MPLDCPTIDLLPAIQPHLCIGTVLAPVLTWAPTLPSGLFLLCSLPLPPLVIRSSHVSIPHIDAS
jgi:hypothetical protein